MSTTLLNKIYDEIIIVDEDKLEVRFDNRIFDLVLSYLSTREKLNYPLIILESSENVKAIKIGALLDICTWSTEDNGSKQAREVEKWMYSNNERKIEVALSITNTYPLNDFVILKAKLEEIKQTFPRLLKLCNLRLPSVESMIERTNKDIKKDSLTTRVLRFLNLN